MAEPAMQVFECVRNLWATRCLSTVASLKIPDFLRDGPRTSTEIAAHFNLHEDSVFRLLRAVSTMGFLEHSESNVFALTATGECLISDVPGSMRAYLVAMCAPGHWLPWGNIESTIESGVPATEMELGADLGSYYSKHPDEGHTFNEAMQNINNMSAAVCLDVYPFEEIASDDMCIVDIGGAHGDFLVDILQKLNRPSIRGILFERPEVIDTAASLVGDEIDLISGDFFDSVPPGDLYLVKHVLHEWTDEHCVKILKNIRASMDTSGRVLVVEVLVQGTESLVDMNMLVMFNGRERTEAEFAELFRQADLKLTRVIRTSTPFAVLEATA
ncbi:hypothetical protein Ae201684P_018156 [Aphanomyces euteiches]|uniref:O-methyltransferase domain-containing protein n=1 Tax=Aphanomyces euteiches TaxID=100861 RepID=A0A6G0X3G6_9STRA|nr:hypothetical protein Ae201684_008932 [Aphanomyces euteiches]KAH9054436.1 hypothetical protein Ae201684P_018156 [Aphanomyces euteiches]KAH9145663.1 hypothetical protein AeRB84_010426 [Aphanomyces euteiches]